ncbi:hypothetical protein [Saccharibacillus sacchari]|uniref:Uncharacterized protein n=1 Tax=Saccharibacillus sacchari TaxID=456493 RepID=A0ACC6P623_9BACL
MKINLKKAKQREAPWFIRRPYILFWVPLGFVVAMLASVYTIYSEWLGLGLQTAVLIVITIRTVLTWLAGIAILGASLWVLISKRGKLLKIYPVFVYVVCWFGLLSLPVILFGSLGTLQVSDDLVNYYTQGTIEERQTSIISTQQVCQNGGTTSICSLWVTLDDGSRYETKGALSDAFEHYEDVEAVRILPSSGRLIGVRTKEGWL